MRDIRLWFAIFASTFLLMAATGNIRWTQLRSGDRHGTATEGQASDGTGTSGNCPKYSADGSLTDSGGTCGGAVTSVNGATGAVIVPVLTAPVMGDWSNFNTSGAAQVPTFVNSRWEFASNATAGDNWQGVQIALPSVPYSKVFRVWPIIDASNFSHAGPGWTDGTKLVMCDLFAVSGASRFVGVNFNSVSSFNGNITLATGLVTGGGNLWPSGIPTWWRLADDSTNWTCDISHDGQFWLNVFTEAHNTFLTATKLLVAADAAGSNATQKVVFDSYK